MPFDLLPESNSLVPQGGAAPFSRPEAPAGSNYYQVLVEHRLLFFSIFAVCVLLSALMSFSMSPAYQAKTTLEIRSVAPEPIGQQPQQAQNSDLAAPQTYDVYITNQMGILQSDRLVRKTAQDIGLQKSLQSLHPTGLVALRKRLGFGTMPQNITADQAIQIADNNLIVRQSRQNSLVEVLFSAEDPKVAANFVNTLVDEYSAQNVEAHSEMSQRLQTWLTKQLSVLRTKLESSESELQAYTSANHLIPTGNNEDSLALSKLRQLQVQLAAVDAERIKAQSQVEALNTGAADSSPQLIDSKVFQDYQIKLADLRRQLAEARQLYTPSNPKTKMIQAQIDELQNTMNHQQVAVEGRLVKDFEAISHEQKMLKAQYDAQNYLVNEENARMIRFDTLKHEVDTNRAIYESVLQKVKESGVAAALQADIVRVVDPAEPPSSPAKPKHLVNLAAGSISGALLGLICVAFAHRRDIKFRNTVLNLSVPKLGVIPTIGPRSAVSGIEFGRDRNRAGRFALGTLPEVPMARGSVIPMHSAFADSRGIEARASLLDAIRGVMMSILHTGIGEGSRKTVLVTSPNAAEGKTTIASHLAAALAETGRRVLLVDADIRRPKLHDVFETLRAPGLYEYARHAVESKTFAREPYVRATKIPNLTLMAAGNPIDGDFSPMYSPRFVEVMLQLRQDYDAILIDAPPVLGVPETRIFTRISDGVVLVLREKVSSAEDAGEAKRQVLQDNGVLLGTIVNDAAAPRVPYYTISKSGSEG